MKAVYVRAPGGPDALEILDVPVPAPGAGQVRIGVEAAAVNPVDVGTRSGELIKSGLMEQTERIAIGWDVAGFVDAVGAGVDRFSDGDAVVGLRDRLSAPLGTQADFVVLDADAVAPAPRTVTLTEASTLPLNGLTAAQALELTDLRPGQTLLVTGGAGALGGFAIELAVLRGLRVVASASPQDEALVRDLGAAVFVPRSEVLADAVRVGVRGGVDGAIDAAVVGIAALDAVRSGGSFVAVAAGAAPAPLRGIRVHNVWIRADGYELARLARLVDSGLLSLRVADVMPLDGVVEAHRRLEVGGLRGRLVLTP